MMDLKRQIKRAVKLKEKYEQLEKERKKHYSEYRNRLKEKERVENDLLATIATLKEYGFKNEGYF